jgi:hypothetical protein
MTKAKVIKKRTFYPHRIYLDTAKYFYKKIDNEENVSWYDLMACMTTTSLSIEAICNTYGHIAIEDFKDFESCSPLAKVRLICKELKIDFDRSKSPFNSISKLIKLRNKLAHPKYKTLTLESQELPIDEARKIYHQGEVLHEIEEMLNPEVVKDSVRAAMKLEKCFRKAAGVKVQPETSEWKLEVIENS